MYSIGEKIIYGDSGVCEIVDISDISVPGQSKKIPYYTIKPANQSCMIYSPVDNNKVYMRPIITKEEAVRLINEIPSVNAEAFHGRTTRESVEHYESLLKTHNCHDLIELTMSIYLKQEEAVKNNRRASSLDERFMKKAEDLLFAELAAALEIDINEVQDYIASCLK